MKIDARTLPASTQQEKRQTAIKLWKKGMPNSDIAELLCVSLRSVQLWIAKFKVEGEKSLKAKRKGNLEGEGRTLSPKQEAQIKKLITDKYPDQLKLDYVLWTRKAVMELIEQETGITMPIRTVGEYLKRWNFTPQKPAKRAYEQNPKAVKKWLDTEYPKIKSKAQKENAEIYWGDETGIRNDSQHERGYAPKGKTPIVKLNAKRASLNMISAITNQGKVRFHLYEGTMNADKLIDFLKRLIKTAKRKVYLILDNLRVHHAYVVKDWLDEHQEEIEVYYLPSYSPELNPDEYLNCDLKAAVHSGKPARSKDKLRSKIVSHMRRLQNMPSRVSSYFKNENIKYAA